MRRRLAILFTSLALVTWLATVALWLRSQVRADVVGVVLPGHLYLELASYDGSVQVQAVSRWPARPSVFRSAGPAELGAADPLVGPMTFTPTPGSQPLHGGFGLWAGDMVFLTDQGVPDITLERRAIYAFAGGPPPATAPLPSVVITTPPWAPAAAATVVVTGWLSIALRRRLRTRRRRQLGLCMACGYDRRHAPGLCPECGAEPPGRIRFRGWTDDLLAGRVPPGGL
jgi:hypothetical protein